MYYVRFKIHRIPRYFYSGNTAIAIWTDADDLTIDLILKNDTDEEKDESLYPPERIATFLVPHTKEMNETDEAEQLMESIKKMQRDGAAEIVIAKTMVGLCFGLIISQ